MEAWEMMMVVESSGERLRVLREAADLTQEELAERANLSQGTISALENDHGKRTPYATWRALAGALGVEPAYLVNGVTARAGEQPADALDRMVAQVRADAAAVADIRDAGPDVDENAIRIGADLLKVYLRGLRGQG